MRRILLIVAMLLIAAPVKAEVKITASPVPIGVVGNDRCSTVEVNYVCTTGEAIRAFALDVTVDNNFIIQGIRNFKTGESVAGNLGYGIFPGSFNRYIDAANPNWVDPNYTPVCPNTYADATGTGVSTNKIIVELGSLYVAGNAPPASGKLFWIDVIPPKPGTAYSGNVSLAANTTRGGVVDINGNSVDPNLTNCTMAYNNDCFPCWYPWHQMHRLHWLPWGKPSCWCYFRQCHGDADGKKQGSSTLGYYYVGSNDVTIVRASYLVKESPKGPGVKGEPNICADFARDKGGSAALGYYRVGSTDIALMSAAYLVKESPKGPGVRTADCGGILVP